MKQIIEHPIEWYRGEYDSIDDLLDDLDERRKIGEDVFVLREKLFSLFKDYPISIIHKYFDEDLSEKYKNQKDVVNYELIDEELMGKFMEIVRGRNMISKWAFIEYAPGDIEVNEIVDEITSELNEIN